MMIAVFILVLTYSLQINNSTEDGRVVTAVLDLFGSGEKEVKEEVEVDLGLGLVETQQVPQENAVAEENLVAKEVPEDIEVQMAKVETEDLEKVAEDLKMVTEVETEDFEKVQEKVAEEVEP